ncbi:MAG TPA: malectin domain-containing carbohydrate-binding protein, partial [Opitutus sp.]|nr:malectin domain-containing carbohydrate-binding protein [Opitutus sp.]
QTGQPETVRVTGPAGFDVSLVVIEGALYLGGVPGGGYDIDPLEANTAIKVTELSGTISPEGFADFTVTPTKTDEDAGLNYITATLIDANDVKGPASDNLIIWYDPLFGGDDTQAPSTPGGLNASSVTHRSVSLSWFASTDNVGVVAYDILRDGTLVSSVVGLTYTDIGLEDGESYIYSVVARDEAGNTSTAATLPVETNDLGAVVKRVNAGGPNFVDSKGNTWAADNGFNTGTTSTTTNAIDRTVDDTLFKTRRVDSAASAPDLIYSFALPNGSYEVQLFLTENDPPNSAAGKRVFDISLEGALAFDNFDTFASAGAPYTAVVLAATTTVLDGQLNIAFGRVTGNPQIGAIKVIALPSDETEPPTAPGTLTFTNVTASTVTVNWTASTD